MGIILDILPEPRLRHYERTISDLAEYQLQYGLLLIHMDSERPTFGRHVERDGVGPKRIRGWFVERVGRTVDNRELLNNI